MTVAPKTLRDLAAYWAAHEGVNLGIVGDTGHAKRGVSYHLGKDQLLPGAYSTERPRDKKGLTNAASAIDLGRLEGDLKHLQRFSDWLARRCVKGVPGTEDVVEVIYSPDGSTVLGFKDGVDFLIPGYGDRTHLSHTHISFFRDSEKRDKTALFEPYFELPDSSTGDDVITTITVLPFGGTYTIPAGREVTGYPANADGSINLAKPKVWPARATASSASYDALMSTSATRGNPFVRGSNGFFEDHYVTTAAVDETPHGAPASDCALEIAAHDEKQRDKALKFVQEELYP